MELSPLRVSQPDQQSGNSCVHRQILTHNLYSILCAHQFANHFCGFYGEYLGAGAIPVVLFC